ncbi:hypothetical protein TNCV_4798631 [Trichonephila clavipes]|nr:hypothetical protein TNCV_4798631 [Trichonephila clavipes]
MLHFGEIRWVLWPPWKARLLQCPLRNLETAVWVHLSQFIARNPPGESARYQAIRCSHSLSGTLLRQGIHLLISTNIYMRRDPLKVYITKSCRLPHRGEWVSLGGMGEVHRQRIFSWQGHPRREGHSTLPI